MKNHSSIERLTQILLPIKYESDEINLIPSSFNEKLSFFSHRYKTHMSREGFYARVETDISKVLKLLENSRINYFHETCQAKEGDEILCIHYKTDSTMRSSIAIPGLKNDPGW